MTAIIIGLVGSLRQGSYNALPLLTASSTPGRRSVSDLTWRDLWCFRYRMGRAPCIQRTTAGRPPNAQLYVSAA